MMRAAIYVHVPEKEGMAVAEEQILRMKAMAMRDGWEVHRVYYDAVPWDSEERPEYEAMLSDAAQHRFDALLFWALEDLSPHNINRTLALLHRLSQWGICFCSYKEHHLNCCHVSGGAVVSLIDIFARQDSAYVSRRVKAALEKQQRTQEPGPQGQIGPGRPRAEFDQEKAKILRGQMPPLTYQEIAKACGVSKATISRFFKDRELGVGNRE